jgi:hypothetical protein
MWYLPVIDHLKGMFSNPRDAELLLWNVNHGKIQHPADGRQWKQFDLAHLQDFSNDKKNIRFGLSINGMSPFGEMRNPHGTYVASYYVHIQSPTMVIPQMKVSFIDNPNIRS